MRPSSTDVPSTDATTILPAAVQAAWREQADALARWAWQQVNRTDCWGAYRPLHKRDGSKSYTAPADRDERREGALTTARLAAHFRGAAVTDVVGLHAIGPDGTSRWVVWDIDRHGDAGDPAANRTLAVGLYDRLVALGFTPLLTESDERGGFHLRVIFAQPVRSDVAHAFARWLAPEGVEAFPKQPELTADKPYGNWMRLPGRHHTRDVWSRAYDGTDWLDGAPAVEVVLATTGDDPGLIPVGAAPRMPVSTQRQSHPKSDEVTADQAIRSCRKYLDKLPPSVSGEHGHDRLFRAACETLRFGVADADALALLAEYNARAVPPWSELDIARKLAQAHGEVGREFGCRLREIRRRPSPPPPGVTPLPGADPAGDDVKYEDADTASNAPPVESTPDRHTDVANARRLVTAFNGRALWNHTRGCWLVYDAAAGVWAEDTVGRVEQTAKGVADAMWATFGGLDPAARGAAIRHATRSSSAGGIGAMISLARSEPGVTVTADQLDADPWLLNVANGVVDLRTGGLRPHDPAEMHTRQAPVAYDPAAPCPAFDAFLGRIMADNPDLIGYAQRLCGLLVTGDVTEQVLPLFIGVGANGKSVLVDTLLGLMGTTYAGLAPPSLLTDRGGGEEHPTELADLVGLRLVVGSETEESARLKVQLVKRLTGDATIKARFMRCDYFEARRTSKVLLVTNNKPVVTEAGNAIWRRLRLVPFSVVIPEAEQDRHLLDKLRAEWPGILAWCVRGTLEWLKGGMRTPEAVQLATAEYAAEQDLLADYLATRIQRGGDNVKVSRPDLWGDYQSWASQAGERYPLTRNAFFDRIRKVVNVTDAKWRQVGTSVIVRGFRGIGLGLPVAAD